MAKYKYSALSRDGVKVSGIVEGFDQFDAVDKIKQDCDIILKITEIEETNQPEDSCVMPPSNEYVPTSGIF